MTANSEKYTLKYDNRTTAKFEKVSLKQFTKDWIEFFPEDKENNEYIQNIYNNIKLPTRGTAKSAGYDFFIPMEAVFLPGGEMVIPTGIKCVNIPDDKWLAIYPRSGIGSKYRFIITNLTGIIDADYPDSEEKEGHILVKMANDGEYELYLDQGKAFCQGIIQDYYITENDSCTAKRTGGFGSTNR